jgi:hypothetical protein
MGRLRKLTTRGKLGAVCLLMAWVSLMIFVALVVPPGGGRRRMSSLPEGTEPWLILAITLFILGMVLVIGAAIRSHEKHKAMVEGIRRNGRTAEAEILEIHDTGRASRLNIVARLVLEVRPSYQRTFQAEVEHDIPRLEVGKLQPGMVLQVKFDPESRRVVLVDE